MAMFLTAVSGKYPKPHPNIREQAVYAWHGGWGKGMVSSGTLKVH